MSNTNLKIKTYSPGEFCVLVPAGWEAFPRYMSGQAQTDAVTVIKGAAPVHGD